MTQYREIQRVLDLWLAEGPLEVPDRVFDDAVDRVFRQPQRNSWRLRLRSPIMTTPIRLAAAVVAILAVVSLGYAVLNMQTTVGPAVSPTPGPTAAPSSTPAAVECLGGECAGALEAGTHRATAPMVPFGFSIDEGWTNVFNAVGGYVLMRTDGQPYRSGFYVFFDLQATHLDRCVSTRTLTTGSTADDLVAWLETHPGVEMTNRLSPTIGGLSGHAFDLTATGDGLLCDGETKLLVQDWSSDPNFWWGIGADERQHMIVLDRGSGGTIVMVVAALDRPEFALFADLVAPILGTIDFDQQCQTDDPECTGALSPGTHSTGQHMTPCSYTVPVGWSKPLDVPGSMNLESRAFSGALIGVIPEWAIASQSACTADPEPGRGRELQDLVDFLAEHPGLIASVPAPVTVGGLEGQVIDIQVDPAFEGPCNGEVSLFTHRGTINDVGWWTIRDSSRGRYYFLDAGDGVVINVIVETVVSEDLDAFLGAATPVVDTFDFSP